MESYRRINAESTIGVDSLKYFLKTLYLNNRLDSLNVDSLNNDLENFLEDLNCRYYSPRTRQLVLYEMLDESKIQRYRAVSKPLVEKNLLDSDKDDILDLNDCVFIKSECKRLTVYLK